VIPSLDGIPDFCLELYFFLRACLLYELGWVSFESFLAGDAAEVVGIAIIGDLELRYIFVQNGTANRVFRHYLDLIDVCVFCLLLLVVKKKRKGSETK
jgi:hypothetical protein